MWFFSSVFQCASTARSIEYGISPPVLFNLSILGGYSLSGLSYPPGIQLLRYSLVLLVLPVFKKVIISESPDGDRRQLALNFPAVSFDEVLDIGFRAVHTGALIYRLAAVGAVISHFSASPSLIYPSVWIYISDRFSDNPVGEGTSCARIYGT